MKAAVGDAPGKRQHDHKPPAGGLDHLRGRLEQPDDHEVVEGRKSEQRVQKREEPSGAHHKAVEEPVGLLVLAKRGGGDEQHDDGRFDKQRERENHAAQGRQVDGGVGQAGDDRAHDGLL